MDINNQVRRIWFNNIFKSYLWLIFPLAFLGGIASCESYIKAGTHLTDASVSVREYYRKDGTYVSPTIEDHLGELNTINLMKQKELLCFFIFRLSYWRIWFYLFLC